MKQVVFAVFLLAMASLTGCLNEEDSPVDDKTDDSPSDTTEDNSDTKDDELIDPVEAVVAVGGYTSPENSSVRVDQGIRGLWINNEYVECAKQGYEDLRGNGDRVYCDLDFHYDTGPQVWVNKTGKTITVECIIHKSGSNCKDTEGVMGAWLLFTSSEGFQERIRVDLATSEGNNTLFFKAEFTLKFEPISFTIEEKTIADLYYPEETNTRLF